MLLTMRHESIAGRVAIHSQAFLFFYDQPKIVCEYSATLLRKIGVGPDRKRPDGQQTSTRLAISGV